jgi:hypothetical protein
VREASLSGIELFSDQQPEKLEASKNLAVLTGL